MAHIAILSSSVRTGRKSDRVALYFKKTIEENSDHQVEILDLETYPFPIFTERLKFLPNPAAEVLDFAEKIKKADAVVIVTPEYNGAYPASLKNVIDLLVEEWRRKPVGIVTVSAGAFGGSQVLGALQFILWKMRAWTVPAMFPVPNVEKSFDEKGLPADPEQTDKRAKSFLDELYWCIQAVEKMRE